MGGSIRGGPATELTSSRSNTTNWDATPGGEEPGDIDLLILGRPDRRRLARLCREASQELGFDVSPTVLPNEDWKSDATGFIRSIKEQPLIPLIESVDDRG